MDRYPSIKSKRNDYYNHCIVRDGNDSEISSKVRKLHADVYLSQGLIKPAAIDNSTGYLITEIDKSLYSPTVIYYAENPGNHQDCASTKLFGSETSTLVDLPSYYLCESRIDEGISRQIDVLLKDHGCQIRELGAMIKAPNASHRAILEVIRAVLHDTVGKDMLVYCSMVEEVHGIMTSYFSSANYPLIGQASIVEEDDFFGRDIAFVPVIIDPDSFVNNLFDEYMKSDDEGQKKNLLFSLMFLSEGMDYRFFSEELINFLNQLEDKKCP